MPSYRMVFWQNIPSPHLLPLQRALLEQGHKVTLVVDQYELPERKAMGWENAETTDVRILRSDVIDIPAFISKQTDEINIIGGIRGLNKGKQVITECRDKSKRWGLMAEPGDYRGLSGLLRRAVYSYEAATVCRDINFILAMGQTGVDWYKKSGFPRQSIFPFCYVVDKTDNDVPVNSADGVSNICYVGSLIHRKRVDLVLRSLSQLNRLNWSLKIVGDGDEKIGLVGLAEKLGVSDRITWSGYLKHDDAVARVAECDVLVLPSEFDGWGAVVNEALMLGVPVVCSDACGASNLITEDMLGCVFRSGSVASLSEAVEHFIGLGKPDVDRRKHIRDWSSCISGDSVARYLTDVLDHVYARGEVPIAPWRVST